ncbi:AI-2E family transporter [uncultured Acetobacterium sp.]|uniref:AI-2E family transporter n=1 Tax=uncultured Acetobacterium sp. TaxID=217139 RepID=UPI0025D95D54|nr:AI-2E family transporter [uncultured Acetobacterium sp.]MDP2843449.1 AI-2E family transporter [Acetobacterium sp.]
MKHKIDVELVKKYSYFLVGILILLLIYKLLDNFGVVTATIGGFITGTLEVLRPILLGVVLAYLLFKPMRGIEKFIFKTIPKSQNKAGAIRLISILIVYVITIILIVLFFYATIPSVVESLTGLISQTPEYLTIIDNYLGESLANGGAAQDILTELKFALDSLQSMTTRDMLNQVASYFGTNPDSIKNIGNFAFVFLKGTIGFVISFFIVFFVGLYLMLDKEKVSDQVDRFAKAVMNKTLYNGSHWAILTIDEIFYKYFTGKILTSMLIGFLFYLGLLVIGVEYAPLFGVIVAITNVIPYFGPIIGAVPAVIITLIDEPIKALWVGIWILIVQQFDGNVLAPNVLGKIVELNPFWVLFSVIVGGSLFGILGMFVAIPVFAVIKVIFEEALTRWEEKKAQLDLEKPLE